MTDKIKIESLGIYLPENTLSMEELLRSCRRRPRWDLERITGIRERRVADEGQFPRGIVYAGDDKDFQPELSPEFGAE